MKASSTCSSGMPFQLGFAIIVAAFLSGCATPQPAGVTSREQPPVAEPLGFQPGSIAIVGAADPASFGFEGSSGRTVEAGESTAAATRAVLEPPALPDPALVAAYGPIGFALAPFAASYGAIKGKNQLMSTRQLATCEADLKRALAEISDQKQFRDSMAQVAGECLNRPVVAADSSLDQRATEVPVIARVETKLESLWLERLAGEKDQFALYIKARSRLIRNSDERVLAEQASTYRSRSALFVDWSRADALAKVARTGYRELARQMVDGLLPDSKTTTLFVGAGNPRQKPARALGNRPMPLLSPDAQIRFVAFSPFEYGYLDVYGSGDLNRLSYQEPLTKDAAASEAVQEVGWIFEGLVDSRNSVVSTAAIAAAIPVSIYKQAVAIVRGMPEKRAARAREQLEQALKAAMPREELAQALAIQIESKTAQPVAFVSGEFYPKPSQKAAQSAEVRLVSRGAALGRGSVVQIRLEQMSLYGKEGINPPLNLHVRARATVYRTADDAEVYVCPVDYRSAGHTFSEWVADDGRLLREESQRCNRELGNAIADELAAKGLIAPKARGLPPVAQQERGYPPG